MDPGSNGLRRCLRPGLGPRCLALAVLFLLGMPGGSLAQSSMGPQFALSLSPCPSALEYGPGLEFEQTFDAVLTTTDNVDSLDGAQGWSISLSATNLEVVGITTRGTVAAKITDDPPGLMDDGFNKTELATPLDGQDEHPCAEGNGAVSAVVLSFVKPVTLPPEGDALIARVTVKGLAPADVGSTTAVSLFYVDGCRGAG